MRLNDLASNTRINLVIALSKFPLTDNITRTAADMRVRY